jgi:RNA ligase
VIRCLRTGGMVKIKQDDYVSLHRIVTGLTERTVWEHLVAAAPLADLIEPLPDEFHEWVRAVAGRIESTVDNEEVRLRQAYGHIVADLPEGFSRKDFALTVSSHPDRWAMFALMDGRDIRGKLLLGAKPDPLSFSGRAFGEDDA